MVTLANRYGTYVGTSQVHPDDKEFASEYAGGRLAEHRAWIKALQSDRRRIKTQYRATLSLYKDILNNCDCPIEVQHRFDVFLKKYQKDLKEIEEDINAINKCIKEDIKIRDKIIKTFIKKN